MKYRRGITVAVVTRDRALELLHCFGSLLIQTKKPDSILVIDNGSEDATAKIIKNLIRNSLLPITYVLEKKHGYTFACNRMLKEAKTRWIATIDDDCVADCQWVEYSLIYIRKYPESAAILGNSDSYYKQNVFSQTRNFFYRHWRSNRLKGDKVLDYEILDTKNLLYNKQFLDLHNIHFDMKLHNEKGTSQDCDVGMHIAKEHGKALFAPNIKISHKDSTNAHSYFRKIFKEGVMHVPYMRKWRRDRIIIEGKLRKKGILSSLGNYIKDSNLNNIIRFQVVFYSVATIAIMSYFRIYYRIKLHGTRI